MEEKVNQVIYVNVSSMEKVNQVIYVKVSYIEEVNQVIYVNVKMLSVKASCITILCNGVQMYVVNTF